MSARAVSFLARGESPARVARALGETVRRLGKPSGALVFVSGEFVSSLEELSHHLEDALGPVPALVAAGHGVLTERGEVENETALSAVVWEGGTTTAIAIEDSGGPDIGVTTATALEGLARPQASAFLFLRPRGVLPHMLDPLKALRFGALVGAGTTGDGGVAVFAPGKKPRIANLGALVVTGVTPPAVRPSPACRLLTPLVPITATRGPMVLELGGERALEALSLATANLKDQPLLFVALTQKTTEDGDESPLLLRGIQGIDPLRQGIVVSEEVREGLLMAFAVRDPVAARADLETAAARLARETAGAAARLGVYLSCAGRGSSLYGAQDVDTRVIRARFGDLPLAGMHASFQIAPHAGSPTLQLYTGVLSVFTEPS
ncbi:MAG: FIST C-terminal domain-containing protein [Myxococcota bacterium]